MTNSSIPDKLCLLFSVFALDQHAAHERILLEDLLKSWRFYRKDYRTRNLLCLNINHEILIEMPVILHASDTRNLSADLSIFGIQLRDLRHKSTNIFQIMSLPIIIERSWTLPDKFILLMSKFICARADYISNKVSDPEAGVIFLE